MEDLTDRTTSVGLPGVLTSQLLGLSEFEQLSPITLRRNSKTQMRAVGKTDSYWLKQGDGQD